MRNFETRFEAQLSRFNSHKAGSIPDALVALMLLGNSNIDDNQRVSILAAAVSNVTPTEVTELSVTDILSAVKYSSIASVLRQCERKKTNLNDGSGRALNANGAHGGDGGIGNGNGGGRFRNRFHNKLRTPAEIAERKKRQPCHYCKRHGPVSYTHLTLPTILLV